MIVRALLLSLLLAGCAPLLPHSPADIQAKRFEAVPEKAVIYLVRDFPDSNDVPATVTLGEARTVTTYPGTYYRWEVDPGTHRIAGFAADNGAITLRVEAGKIYFVQQRLTPWMTYALSYFHPVTEPQGRAVAMRGVLLGGW
jgi:hypothetical protein